MNQVRHHAERKGEIVLYFLCNDVIYLYTYPQNVASNRRTHGFEAFPSTS